MRGVYIIENLVTGQVYVGSTATSFAKRWRAHRAELRRGVHTNRQLQEAWNQHGEASFTFDTLEVIDDPATILEREQHWISQLWDDGRCYNILPFAASPAWSNLPEEDRKRLMKNYHERLNVVEDNPVTQLHRMLGCTTKELASKLGAVVRPDHRPYAASYITMLERDACRISPGIAAAVADLRQRHEDFEVIKAKSQKITIWSTHRLHKDVIVDREPVPCQEPGCNWTFIPSTWNQKRCALCTLQKKYPHKTRREIYLEYLEPTEGILIR